MNFHETPIERRFFNQQLPLLTTALQDVAKALTQDRQVVRLSPEIPADFMHNFFYGRYDPSDYANSAEYDHYSQRIMDHQTVLLHEVTPEIWGMIDHYQTLLEVRATLDREQAFNAGFRSALTLVMAGLSAPPAAAQAPGGAG